MNSHQFEGLLASLGDALPGRNAGRGPETALLIVPFLDLAHEIAALIVPVHPRREFRADLGRDLLAVARQRQAQQPVELVLPSSHATGLPLVLFGRVNEWAGMGLNELGDLDRRWVVSAAVVGSALSLAGVLAYVLHQRSRLLPSAELSCRQSQ